MPTKLEVANMALGMAGARRLLSDISENSREAELVRTFYTPAQNLAQALGIWPCLKTTERLKLVARREGTWVRTQPSPCWKFAHEIPPAFVRPLAQTEKTPFAIFMILGVMRICSDVESPVLQYIADFEEERWDPMFARTVSAYLARDIVYPLTGDPRMAQSVYNTMQSAIDIAATQIANFDQRDPLPWWPGNFWIGDRGGICEDPCGGYGSGGGGGNPPTNSPYFGVDPDTHEWINGGWGTDEASNWAFPADFLVDDQHNWVAV